MDTICSALQKENQRENSSIFNRQGDITRRGTWREETLYANHWRCYNSLLYISNITAMHASSQYMSGHSWHNHTATQVFLVPCCVWGSRLLRQLNDFSQDTICNNRNHKNQPTCQELFYPLFIPTTLIRVNLLAYILTHQHPEFHTSAKIPKSPPQYKVWNLWCTRRSVMRGNDNRLWTLVGTCVHSVGESQSSRPIRTTSRKDWTLIQVLKKLVALSWWKRVVGKENSSCTVKKKWFVQRLGHLHSLSPAFTQVCVAWTTGAALRTLSLGNAFVSSSHIVLS